MTDKAEEILEALWVKTQEEGHPSVKPWFSQAEDATDELIKSGHIKIASGKISFTDKGKEIGENLVRRHRLSERLFTDVLELKKKFIHSISCQFEHLLHEGTEDNICILLGHPVVCPHGKPIPAGKCCKEFKEITNLLISPLTHLRSSQKGKIAYLRTKDNKILQKLMAMGVFPGTNISLVQKFPSFVFQIGHSQFAIDKEMAENIYVRIAQ